MLTRICPHEACWKPTDISPKYRSGRNFFFFCSWPHPSSKKIEDVPRKLCKFADRFQIPSLISLPWAMFFFNIKKTANFGYENSEILKNEDK